MKDIKVDKNISKIKYTIDILDIAGSFHPRKNKRKSALAAREHMETNYKRV